MRFCRSAAGCDFLILIRKSQGKRSQPAAAPSEAGRGGFSFLEITVFAAETYRWICRAFIAVSLGWAGSNPKI
jgi:hypothetical protein